MVALLVGKSMKWHTVVALTVLCLGGCSDVVRSPYQDQINAEYARFLQEQQSERLNQEERAKRDARTKAEEAYGAQQEKEKLEAGVRQLEQDTATFLREHAGKSVRSMPVIEVDELIGLWKDLQIRWLYSTDGAFLDANDLAIVKGVYGGDLGMLRCLDDVLPDPSNIPKINFLSLETFCSVFGEPARVLPDPIERIVPTYWFLYECKDSTIRIKVFVIKKDDFRMTGIVGSRSL